MIILTILKQFTKKFVTSNKNLIYIVIHASGKTSPGLKNLIFVIATLD
jgi:hypothetical protein